MNGIHAPLFISAATAGSLFTWTEAIEALRSAYQRPAQPEAAPPRVVARGEQGVWFRALVAVSPSGAYMGAKLFGLSRDRSVSYLTALFDQQTGQLACILDANSLTAFRTAATSALAVDAIAPETPARIALLGSGAEARAHLRAIAAVRPVASVRIFSPTAANREKFATEMANELSLDCAGASSPEDAIAGASIVIAAARSRDEKPTFKADWIGDGVLVVSIGSTLPSQREVETALIERADMIVADVPEEVVHDTGDFIACACEGIAVAPKLMSLHDAVANRRGLAISAARRPLFKSVGSALQDITIAELCLAKAIDLGRAESLGAEFMLKPGPTAGQGVTPTWSPRTRNLP